MNDAELERLYQKCLNYASSLTGNRDDAEDLVQESFAAFYRHIRYAEKSVPVIDAVMYKILRNKWIDRHRTNHSTPMSICDALRREESGTLRIIGIRPQQPIEEIALGHLCCEDVKTEIRKLGAAYQEVLMENLFGEKDCAEISEALHLTRAAANKRITRGKEKLREKWKKTGRFQG
jgi:RNA polymerase sigma factor (sigma-70 family)